MVGTAGELTNLTSGGTSGHTEDVRTCEGEALEHAQSYLNSLQKSPEK